MADVARAHLTAPERFRPPSTRDREGRRQSVPDPEEGNLISRSQRGELEAFDQLVAAHEDRIFHVAYRITGNREDARDVAQVTFIKAYRALGRYRHQAAFGTWLHRIAVNAALDTVRRRPAAQPAPLEEVTLPATAHDPEVTAERRELAERVHQALGRLSPDHRTIIVLRDLQDLAYEEIAEVLRIPLGTVRSRLSRARDALRPLLADLAAETGMDPAPETGARPAAETGARPAAEAGAKEEAS